MKIKPKVTVYIPAFNEQSNIKSILKQSLKQTRNSFVLEKILVVDDGSTDNTSKIVRSFKNKKIKLISHKENKGKNIRNNEIFSKFDGDILVQLDADGYIRSKNMLENLVSPFFEKENISMTCGIIKPLPPQNFAEKIAMFGVKAWNRSIVLSNYPERHLCHGQVRAFSRDFANKLIITEKKGVLSEDIYSFFLAKKQKRNIAIAWDSIVYFRLPASLADYRKQMKRFISTAWLAKDVFGESLTKKYDVLRVKQKVIAFIVEFLKDPVVGSIYATLQIFTRIEALFYKPKAKWEVSVSTKNI